MTGRPAAVLVAAALLAGCGGGDSPDDRIRDVAEQIRSGAPGALDEADEALQRLEDSDLPEDARRELEEAKRLLDDAQP